MDACILLPALSGLGLCRWEFEGRMCGTLTDGASLPSQQEESENPVVERFKSKTTNITSMKKIPVWIKLKSKTTVTHTMDSSSLLAALSLTYYITPASLTILIFFHLDVIPVSSLHYKIHFLS